jgi:hypothetical protein
MESIFSLGDWDSNPGPTGYSTLSLSKETGLCHHPCRTWKPESPRA